MPLMRLPSLPRLLLLPLLLALTVAACDENGGDADVDYVERAIEYREAGDVDAALIEARNAVQANPDNPEARRLLGELFLASGNVESAAAQFGRARELGLRDESMDVQLGRAWLAMGRFEDLLSDIPAPEAIESETDAELAVLRGNALLAVERVEEARDAFERVIVNRPRADAYAGLARIALANEDYEEARRQIDRGQRMAPDDPELLQIAGELSLREGEADTAEESFRRLLEAEETNIPARLGAARALIAAERYEEAAAELDRVLEAIPDGIMAIYFRALTAYQLEDYATAQRLLDRVLAAIPDNVQALILAGASAYAEGQDELALRHLGRAVNLAPDNVAARQLLAATQMRAELFDEALDTLGPELERETDDAELLTIAGIAALRAGNLEDSSRLFGQAVDVSPEDPVARTRLGLMRMAEGADRLAIEELEQALARQPDLLQAEVLLILALVRNGELDRAIAEAERMQENRPDTAVGYVLGGIAKASAERMEAARADFERAMEIEPGQPDAGNNLALLALAAEDAEAARANFRRVLAENPDHLPTLVRLARLNIAQGDGAAAQALLEEAVERRPNDQDVRALLAQFHIALGDGDAALDVLQPAIQDDQEPTAAMLETLGLAHLAAGQPNNAVAAFRSLASREPGSAAAFFRLAQAMEAAGDAGGMRSALERALEIDPEQFDAKLAYARLLLGRDDLDAAAEAVADLKETAGGDPRIADLEARLLLAQGDPAGAVEVLRAAVETTPTAALTQTLARTEWLAGERGEALDRLRTWLAENPGDLVSRMLLANFLLADDALEEAREQYLAVVEQAPDNVLALNNLAWVMSELGDLEGAVEHAEAAYAGAPENPLVIDTLGVILLERGDTDRALELLSAADELAGDNPEIAFHHARALAAAGRTARALETLERALASEEPFGGREEAEALARRLGG
jgi:putative PEP-CTERM system TPR-repeat lipoprotein